MGDTSRYRADRILSAETNQAVSTYVALSSKVHADTIHVVIGRLNRLSQLRGYLCFADVRKEVN